MTIQVIENRVDSFVNTNFLERVFYIGNSVNGITNIELSNEHRYFLYNHRGELIQLELTHTIKDSDDKIVDLVFDNSLFYETDIRLSELIKYVQIFIYLGETTNE